MLLFLEYNFSTLIVSEFFCKKSENFQNLEKLQNLMTKGYFLRQKRFHPYKGILSKIVGGKYAGRSQLFCLYLGAVDYKSHRFYF